MNRLSVYLEQFDWLVVRADEVQPDDLYANGATVTKSRKAKADEKKWVRDGEARTLWHIKCGKSFSVTTDADSPVVIGRRKRVAGVA